MSPFRIKEDSLNSHFEKVEVLLASVVSEPRLRLEKAAAPDGVTIGLKLLEPCETVERNRGGEAVVAPLLDLGGGLSAWFGIREQWRLASRRGEGRSFTFGSCDLTVHFGRTDVVSKPQLFRAEWVGLVEAEGNWGFVAGDAAHPHWQFDALDTFAQEEERDFAVELRQLLRGETQLPTPDPEIQVTEFSFLGEETSPLEIGDDDIGLLVRHRKVSAIHFPSVAPWWLDKSDHAHMPGNAGHVRLWLDKTLRYVRTELSRV